MAEEDLLAEVDRGIGGRAFLRHPRARLHLLHI
jgi:hypothetical protein